MAGASTVCPRCAHETINELYTSPVPGIWEVLQCAQCLYMWRTSEPARRTERDDYPDEFKLTTQDIANAPEVPTIPPLRTRA
jgi:vanillate/4-hydroxybenzoate decarboxylase subunit D